MSRKISLTVFKSDKDAPLFHVEGYFSFSWPLCKVKSRRDSESKSEVNWIITFNSSNPHCNKITSMPQNPCDFEVSPTERGRVCISNTLAFDIREGNGHPPQCSCLENPRAWGAWWAAVYGVTQSQTRLTWVSSSSSVWYCYDFLCLVEQWTVEVTLWLLQAEL